MLQFAVVFVGSTLLLAILSDRLRDAMAANSSQNARISTWRSNKLLIIALSMGFSLIFALLPQLIASM